MAILRVITKFTQRKCLGAVGVGIELRAHGEHKTDSSLLRISRSVGLLRYYTVGRTLSSVVTNNKMKGVWGMRCVSLAMFSAAAACVSATQGYTISEKGRANTLDYKVYIIGPNGAVSPFHDIPLYPNAQKTTYNMIVEIPRWTNAKMEINKAERLNPIMQDEKNGDLRYVDNCFPHHGYIWNYGAFPQTWEDPEHIDEFTSQRGDNDPIDVCEIGSKVHTLGSVIEVKVLGILALIDEGETDWKVIVIDVSDPLAIKMNDIDDVEEFMPGFLEATVEWFRDYKLPKGKPQNRFAFNGQLKDKAFAETIVRQTHQQWKALMNERETNDLISVENTSLGSSPYWISSTVAQAILNSAPPKGNPAPIPGSVDKWYYVRPATSTKK